MVKLLRLVLGCCLLCVVLLGAETVARAGELAVAEPVWLVPQGKLTLSQARALALASSPSVTEAVARIRAAQAVVRRAESSLWPQLAVHSGYRYNDGVEQLDWAPEQRMHDSFTASSAGLRASWLLFDGFQRRATILAAEYQTEQAEQLLSETRRLLLQAVSTAYFQAQLALEEMVVAQESRKFNRVLEDESRKRWQAGAIPEAEMLNFSVRALQAESDFLAAEQRFDIACAILVQLMATDIEPGSAVLMPQRAPQNALVASRFFFAEELDHALTHRPDLKAIDAQIAALRQQQRAVKGAYLPQLQAVAGMDVAKQHDLGRTDQDEHASYAGLELNWQLFNGGERAAHRRQLEQQVEQLQAARHTQELEIRSLLRQALTRAEAARHILQRQLQAHELTVKIRHHIAQSYRAGVATLTRLNEAQTDLVAAAGRVAQSRINYLQAEQDVMTESGRLLTVQ